MLRSSSPEHLPVEVERVPDLRGLIEPVEQVIVPVTRRLKLRDLSRAAPVIRVLAARDFKVKYKQSLLGPLWVVFQPLALLVAFLVAFRGLGDVRSSGVPYVVFALAALSAWTFFQAALTNGAASLISNYSLVRFTPCPRIAFPLAAIISSLPSFAAPAIAGIVAAGVTGRLSPRVLLLPMDVIWLLTLSAGAVAILASVAVRYRDVLSALPFLLQLGTFLAPVGYSLAGLSPTMRLVVEANPMTGLIEAFRWTVISGYTPSVGPILFSLVATALLAAVGWRLFTRTEVTMADVI